MGAAFLLLVRAKACQSLRSLGSCARAAHTSQTSLFLLSGLFGHPCLDLGRLMSTRHRSSAAPKTPRGKIPPPTGGCEANPK
ncbi:hypothetical protein PF010_g19091 [Phytophthora fragariae]|uniref:RxLR effector protein n=1 Tax=Phytophthora fragariae TaxID=53985 RepID=A0A6A3H6X6_9STRA|nr:hypothetical protein PF011_g28551 [Phytophthora fragariae]KAE9089212.1 hypothetical protein PF010_g19091 [Phytophthora fragariae]